MIDPFLFAIIVLLLGVILYLLHTQQQERKSMVEGFTVDKNKLINALIAKKPEEYRDLTLADKVAPIAPPPEQTPPDMIAVDQLSDEDFDQHIAESIANA